MKKNIILGIAFALSAITSVKADQSPCPETSVPLAGLTPKEIGDYRTRCKMQVDFEQMTLTPLQMAPSVEAGKFGIRAEGVNSPAY
ncbi:MAG: hypothetical protein K2X90_01210 [Candidatus Babeliaceae bacterium]|nr:hypothetical protein [Candidatus Babeliaceae bacterium]